MSRATILVGFCLHFFGVTILSSQNLVQGWYFGLTKPADLHITMAKNLRRQVSFQNSAFPALQLGYYRLGKK